ncbi:spore germination protein [Paenibacillus sp. FSL R5-0527]|uniref:spore germination protein n=1 Tax=Paenibacillus sp. FSL R5-0527 TaxID=2975321 RepID=UPI00097B1F2B|nr:spore germination protein [Paenibacillus macerans]
MSNDTPILKKLAHNEQQLRQSFDRCSDIVFRPVSVHGAEVILLIYTEGMTDTQLLDQILLRLWLSEGEAERLPKPEQFGRFVEDTLAAAAQVKKTSQYASLIEGVLEGQTAILFEGQSYALLADLIKMEQRGIEEPPSEKVVRGPRDAFTETISVNTSLLRRRIHSPSLKMESMSIGELTGTEVKLVYMENVAKPSLVEEVRKRLGKIRIDALNGSGILEELIEEQPYSPFPEIQNTERPDVAAGSLLEGKVVILMDNSPFALICPMTYWSGLQSPEDYHERFIYTTFVRWVRYIFVHTSLLLPSLYVALTTFHPQVLPTSLLVSVASAREGVPFPAVFEALLMEFLFEGLREAGIRLPNQIGSAVSIAGTLVIGQAAVEAGIISAPMVIIVATTGIASFAFPRYNLGTAYRMLRFPLLIVSGMFGFYGIVLFITALTIHLVCLKSFGVPYMTPLGPSTVSRESADDVLVRGPTWNMPKTQRHSLTRASADPMPGANDAGKKNKE